MGNAANNASQGYNRGKAKIESSKEKQYKRISPNQMKKMQENGFEPHGYKPNRATGKKLIITKINREIYIIVLRMEHILSRHT